MCKTWTLAVLTLMTSSAAISRSVWPRASNWSTEQLEHLALAAREAKDVLGIGMLIRAVIRKIEADPLREQLELALQEPCAEITRNPLCLTRGVAASMRDEPADRSSSA
jgi:hypothetical protein